MGSKSTIVIAVLRAQAAVKEMERIAELKRLKWFEENYEKVYQNPAIPKDQVPKKAAVLYGELKKMRKERFKADRQLRAVPPERRVVKIAEDKNITFDVMYPVPSAVKRTLYEGVSHDEEGRFKYLKLRNQDNPHDKFLQKITSGFEYGWRIKETGRPPKKDHCRRNTWNPRMNGALDDPLRRLPNPSGHITFPFL